MLKRLVLVCLIIGLAGGERAVAQNPQQPEFDRAQVFDEVCTLTQEHFYDPNAVGETWQQARDQMRPRALAALSQVEFAQVMNELLATLKASHTHYFAATSQRRNQLLGIFQGLVPQDREDLFRYDSIGVEVEQVLGKTFVRAVYDGFPASAAGLCFGDEIISIDDQPLNPPFDEIKYFQGKKEVQLKLRRQAAEPPRTLTVAVASLDSRTMFEQALLASARMIERNQKQIAYVHVWSYAGSKYQDHLRTLLLYDKLKGADALVLDLRDGWGGASLEYLNLFREPIADMKSRPRAGEPINFSGVWGKPVVLLVNRRTTSGKELFTYGFKKLQLGEVVGEKTAGAVVAGRAFLLANGDALYVAVADIEIDGQRLEGRGVEPTRIVERPLPYAAGADPQLEQAIEILAK